MADDSARHVVVAEHIDHAALRIDLIDRQADLDRVRRRRAHGRIDREVPGVRSASCRRSTRRRRPSCRTWSSTRWRRRPRRTSRTTRCARASSRWDRRHRRRRPCRRRAASDRGCRGSRRTRRGCRRRPRRARSPARTTARAPSRIRHRIESGTRRSQPPTSNTSATSRLPTVAIPPALEDRVCKGAAAISRRCDTDARPIQRRRNRLRDVHQLHTRQHAGDPRRPPGPRRARIVAAALEDDRDARRPRCRSPRRSPGGRAGTSAGSSVSRFLNFSAGRRRARRA